MADFFALLKQDFERAGITSRELDKIRNSAAKVLVETALPLLAEIGTYVVPVDRSKTLSQLAKEANDRGCYVNIVNVPNHHVPRNQQEFVKVKPTAALEWSRKNVEVVEAFGSRYIDPMAAISFAVVYSDYLLRSGNNFLTGWYHAESERYYNVELSGRGTYSCVQIGPVTPLAQIPKDYSLLLSF